jgi:hypothetical protein
MAGVPEPLVGSTLEHPELGPLGTMIRDLQLTTYLVVVHEPQVQTTRMRRNTFGAYLAADPGLQSGSPPLTPDDKPMHASGAVSPNDISLSVSIPPPAMKRMFDKKDAELYPIHEDPEADGAEGERHSDKSFNKSRVSSTSPTGKAPSYRDILSKDKEGKDKLSGDELRAGDTSTTGRATAAVTTSAEESLSNKKERVGSSDRVSGAEDENNGNGDEDEEREGNPDNATA